MLMNQKRENQFKSPGSFKKIEKVINYQIYSNKGKRKNNKGKFGKCKIKDGKGMKAMKSQVERKKGRDRKT